MRQSPHRQALRPVGSAAFSKMLSRAWSLPPQRNFVAIERNVQVPMSDNPNADLFQSPAGLVVSQSAGKAAAHA